MKKVQGRGLRSGFDLFEHGSFSYRRWLVVIGCHLFGCGKIFTWAIQNWRSLWRLHWPQARSQEHAETKEAKALWIVIAAIIAVDAIWLWLSKISIAVSPAFFAWLLLLAAINLVYTTLRPNRRIAAFALVFAQLLAFISASAVFSYLTATMRFP